MTFDELTDVVALATITGSVALGVPYASGYISGCIQASKLGCYKTCKQEETKLKQIVVKFRIGSLFTEQALYKPIIIFWNEISLR